MIEIDLLVAADAVQHFAVLAHHNEQILLHGFVTSKLSVFVFYLKCEISLNGTCRTYFFAALKHGGIIAS